MSAAANIQTARGWNAVSAASARQLHYSGDHTADIVGRVMGPTMLGQLLTVYAADYDAATDTTTAHLRPATQPEVEQARQQVTAPAAFSP